MAARSQRGVALLYTTVEAAKTDRMRKLQRLLRKVGYSSVAECTLTHWLLNRPAAAP